MNQTSSQMDDGLIVKMEESCKKVFGNRFVRFGQNIQNPRLGYVAIDKDLSLTDITRLDYLGFKIVLVEARAKENMVIHIEPKEIPEWYENQVDLLNFAKHLHDKDEFDDTDAVLYFFEKPWKWNEEWKEYKVSETEFQKVANLNYCDLDPDAMMDSDGSDY